MTPDDGVTYAPPDAVSPMPTAGRRVTDFERELDEQINKNPKPPHGGARAGAGRKTKPKPAPEPEARRIPPSEISDAITELLKAPFDIWAAKAQLPQLALTDDEAVMLTGPVQTLLDYYLPGIRAIDWAWISLGITGVAIMRPRMLLLKEVGPIGQGGGVDVAPVGQGSKPGANGRSAPR